MIKTRIIKTVYPCCNGLAKLVAITALVRQNYNRVCPLCATKYLVERVSVDCPNLGGIIDMLNWTDKATRLYTNKYG